MIHGGRLCNLLILSWAKIRGKTESFKAPFLVQFATSGTQGREGIKNSMFVAGFQAQQRKFQLQLKQNTGGTSESNIVATDWA